MYFCLSCIIAVVITSSAMAVQEQTSAEVKLVPLGQVDNPQLQHMRAAPCGPYFTLAATDQSGLGFLNLAVDRGEGKTEVVTVLLGAIQLHRCKDCEQPAATLTRDSTNYRVDLTMTEEQRKLSPCLRRLKFAKD